MLCHFPNLLVVPNSSPFNSVADLLAEARKNPGKVTFATPGHGSSPHMSGELFKYLAKVDLTHVPYRGASPRLYRPDRRARRLHFRGHGVRAAAGAVAGSCARSPSPAPSGSDRRRRCRPSRRPACPATTSSSWFAFFAPAKTPPEIIRKIHADTVAALAEPPIRAKLEPQALIPVGSTPEQLAAHLKAEMEKWAPVIKAANIKVNE